MAQRPLIGTSPNQVSTNGMLGDLAFQDSNGAYIETIRGAVNLDKLDKEITDTAVDIFVYDTRKDSDSGAWRKRTQHTSWYNETLNTATRGSRREFPAVAVIVATSNAVTIYDGDDPDLPMWMVFNTNRVSYAGSYMLWGTHNVVIKNGLMTTGSTRGIGFANVLTQLNFINESSSLRTTAGIWYGLKNIANRNTENQTIANSTGTNPDDSNKGIVDNSIDDLAITVLSNAPVDPTTGIPVPTVAIATENGVSIIKDDGTVVDFKHTSPYNDANGIQFLDDNSLILTGQNSGAQTNNHWVQIFSIPSTDESASGWGDLASALRQYASPLGGTLINNIALTPTDYSNSGSEIVDFYKNKAFGYNDKLTLLYDVAESPTSSSVAYATTSYNTGWMHGDIKGAFLSDTDATNVTAGSNYVTNGTFDSDSDWTRFNNNTVWTISGGTASMSATTSYLPLYQYNLGLTAGKRYVASVDVTAVSGQLKFDTAASDGTSIDANYGVVITTTGTHTFTFTAESDQDGIGIARDASINSSCTIDNITIYELQEQDRSVNNKGLQVFGTITKTPVSTGAELVAYSGFSNNTNFLRQPYNSGLDFGTGDFSVTGWFKLSDVSTTGFIFDRADVSSAGNRVAVYTETSLLKFYTYDGSATEETSSISGLNNTWVHFVATRSSNGYTAIYLNGNLKDSMTGTSRNVTNTTAPTTIGARFTGATNAFSGSIALLRFSASIPSPEQIRKIYEDEKVLFQENAACTLYGSSDAVTALAYDEDLQLLHAGTSSGRSDFQGLRRINNTTTAVTTAISASNGLVAEQ